MAKSNKPAFKIVVKNGDTRYVIDKLGQYKTKTVDYVQEFDTFAEALAEYAGFVADQYGEEAVTLTFNPNKKN